MQDKRFYPYLFLHAGIVTLWVIWIEYIKGLRMMESSTYCRLPSCFVISICSIFM